MRHFTGIVMVAGSRHRPLSPDVHAWTFNLTWNSSASFAVTVPFRINSPA